jgi:protein-tyrosine kinase
MSEAFWRLRGYWSSSSMSVFTRRRPLDRQSLDDSAAIADQPPAPGDINYTQTQRRAVQPEVLARNLIVTGAGSDAVSSAYKMLRTHVLQRMNANGWNALAITSPGLGEGKTITALNLAITMAREVNHTVLLVELDLRRPTLHSLLGYEPGPGITDYLLRDTPLSEVMFNPGIDRLVVIPAGPPAESSSELLSSPRMVDLVRELKERYPSRLVLFDVPPLLTSDDGLAFVPYVDAALLVVAEGETSYEDVELAKSMLVSTHLLGAVLNRASSQIR